ncbi:galectin-3b [Nerophis lumbriciformis]|uniref:galectin-3b n=1 Tax=Nerophis lumbriciformis TaxID=546530 RepID=UPI002ADFB1A2|nr:galectin-3-like [Nerophis lumbriciformis]
MSNIFLSGSSRTLLMRGPTTNQQVFGPIRPQAPTLPGPVHHLEVRVQGGGLHRVEAPGGGLHRRVEVPGGGLHLHLHRSPEVGPHGGQEGSLDRSPEVGVQRVQGDGLHLRVEVQGGGLHLHRSPEVEVQGVQGDGLHRGGGSGGSGGWPAPGGGGPGGSGSWPAPQSGGGPSPSQGGGGPGGSGSWPAPQSGGGPSPSQGTGPKPTSLAVPFSQSFPHGLRSGTNISISGKIKANPNKFVVDFGSSRDLAFHFNPRFNEYGKKVVVRNSRISNKWGPEERHLDGRFPFTAGQPFQMRIQCTDQMFKVFVDSNPPLEFKNRGTPLGKVDKLTIYEDVTLSQVNIN